MTTLRGPALGACPGSTYEGVDAMGRGRQKAKQTKVARQLKYFSPNTDYNALQRELAADGHESEFPARAHHDVDAVDDDEDDDDDAADDDEDDEFDGWDPGRGR
jgi:hypothetical protein